MQHRWLEPSWSLGSPAEEMANRVLSGKWHMSPLLTLAKESPMAMPNSEGSEVWSIRDIEAQSNLFSQRQDEQWAFLTVHTVFFVLSHSLYWPTDGHPEATLHKVGHIGLKWFNSSPCWVDERWIRNWKMQVLSSKFLWSREQTINTLLLIITGDS